MFLQLVDEEQPDVLCLQEFFQPRKVKLADSLAARRIRQIEQCANRVAEPVVARALLAYVADGRAYEYQRPAPPIGRNQFYVLAQLFYIELDRVLMAG